MPARSRIPGPMTACLAAALLTVGILYPAASAPWRQGGEKKHGIDTALDACLEKNSSTAGMVQCYDAARKSWDRELNLHYQTLRGKLDAGGRAALRTAQLQWLKFRDAELGAVRGVYARTDGTMYRPMAAADVMDITRQRALQLKGYLDVLTIDQP